MSFVSRSSHFILDSGVISSSWMFIVTLGRSPFSVRFRLKSFVYSRAWRKGNTRASSFRSHNTLCGEKKQLRWSFPLLFNYSTRGSPVAFFFFFFFCSWMSNPLHLPYRDGTGYFAGYVSSCLQMTLLLVFSEMTANPSIVMQTIRDNCNFLKSHCKNNTHMLCK